MSERIQKILARLGYGSRRQMEEWIRAGRVGINGRPAALGDSAGDADVVTVDGRRVEFAAFAPACRVIAYNKPEGEICTRSDPEGRPSIFARLPALQGLRWVGVGRLDLNTSGLILLTTDGDLANRLMHPSSNVEREYLVRVMGEVTSEMLEQLRKGVELEDGPASFSRVYEIGGRGVNRWYGVVLREGRKREVRRLWEALGVKVSRLKRIRFGPISLPAQLRRGQFMELDGESIAALRQLARAPGQSQDIQARDTQSRESKSRDTRSRESSFQGQAQAETPSRSRLRLQVRTPVGAPRSTERTASRSSPPRTSSRPSSRSPRPDSHPARRRTARPESGAEQGSERARPARGQNRPRGRRA